MTDGCSPTKAQETKEHRLLCSFEGRDVCKCLDWCAAGVANASLTLWWHVPIAQVHSDCGGVFLAVAFRKATPANTAEQRGMLGWSKQKTIALLQEGRLPLGMWSHAMVHACFLLRQAALKRAVPDKFPSPGNCVLVPAREEAVREGGDIMSKVRYGVYVGDETIPEVVALREGSVMSFVHVSVSQLEAVAHACPRLGQRSCLGVQ